MIIILCAFIIKTRHRDITKPNLLADIVKKTNTLLKGRIEMNFDKLLELGWEDLALGIGGSALVMFVINYVTLL